MSIPYRERRLLRHRARALRAADPHLAAMLAVFAQITAAEALPAAEQIRRRWPRLQTAAAAVAGNAMLLFRAAARGVRRAAAGCASGLDAFCRRLAGAGTTRRPPAPTARQ
jgi:sugar phosphate permease